VTTDPPEGEASWSGRRRRSRSTFVWCAVTAIGLVLDRMMLDAASEAIGSGLLLLVIVSVVGALIRSNRE
jgi:hypothetical protein